MQEVSPHLIAAILLTQFVLAQHIGLRKLGSLREAIGVCATIVVATPIAGLIDWVLLHTVLQPSAIAYLHLFVGMILTAAITPTVEILLRARFKQWFPLLGGLTPLAMTTCCTLIAAQIVRAPDAAFWQALIDIVELSFGAVFLLLVLQALRERVAAKPSVLFNFVADDILNAAFILVALYGVVSIGS